MLRFTEDNTQGASQELLEELNQDYTELTAGLHNEEVKELAARLVVRDCNGCWVSSTMAVFLVGVKKGHQEG